MDIEQIVNYMIETGTEETTEGNYIFFTEEIAERFNCSFEQIQNMSDDILEELDSREEVAASSYESNNSFYITFWRDYCTNI